MKTFYIRMLDVTYTHYLFLENYMMMHQNVNV